MRKVLLGLTLTMLFISKNSYACDDNELQWVFWTCVYSASECRNSMPERSAFKVSVDDELCPADAISKLYACYMGKK